MYWMLKCLLVSRVFRSFTSTRKGCFSIPGKFLLAFANITTLGFGSRRDPKTKVLFVSSPPVSSNGVSSSTREGADLCQHLFLDLDPTRPITVFFCPSTLGVVQLLFCRSGNLLTGLVSTIKLGFGVPLGLTATFLFDTSDFF